MHCKAIHRIVYCRVTMKDGESSKHPNRGTVGVWISAVNFSCYLAVVHFFLLFALSSLFFFISLFCKRRSTIMDPTPSHVPYGHSMSWSATSSVPAVGGSTSGTTHQQPSQQPILGDGPLHASAVTNSPYSSKKSRISRACKYSDTLNAWHK